MDKQKITQAIDKYTLRDGKPTNWYTALYNAPAHAMERIVLSFYYATFKDDMTDAERDEYHRLRREIDLSLENEDLAYLVRVMPEKQQEYYYKLMKLAPTGSGYVGNNAEAQEIIEQNRF